MFDIALKNRNTTYQLLHIFHIALKNTFLRLYENYQYTGA
jgi:hypothetical protein